MIARAASLALLLIVNLIILAIGYAALLTGSHASSAYRAATIGGGVFLGVVALLTFAPGTRRRLMSSPASRKIRTALAISPWIALTLVVVWKGLWWTQRPFALRFFALYALANWTVAWCAAGTDVLLEASSVPVKRAMIALAAALGVLGIEGAAFGLAAYGCGVSAFVAATAALALALGCFATQTACLKLFAASAATLTAVAVMESTTRLLQIGHNVSETDVREYAREFYSLTPPGSAFVNTPTSLDEFGPALVSINSIGIRGPELADKRVDVLLIGDSFVEARQLPWERTIGPQLQQALRSRASPLTVVAHGMRGWSPLLEWNWYLKVGRTLHPRFVMLFFFWNDLWTAGDEATTFNASLTPDGRPDHFDVPVDSNWIWYKHVRVVRLAADVWRRVSVAELRRAFAGLASRPASSERTDDDHAEHLARRLAGRSLTPGELDALLTRPERELDPELRSISRTSLWPGLRPLNLWTDAQRTAAAKTEAELHRFAQDVASDRGRLVLVYVPDPMQIGPRECSIGRLFERIDRDVVLPSDSGIQTWLRGVSERQRIELLDPSNAMRDFDRARLPHDAAPLYLRADCHWSERGHAFMAAYLADWFERNPRGGRRASRREVLQ